MTQSTIFYSLSNPPTFRKMTSDTSYLIEKPNAHDTSVILTEGSVDYPTSKPRKIKRTNPRNSFGKVSIILFGPILSNKQSKYTQSHQNIIPSILFPSQQINKSKYYKSTNINIEEKELSQFKKEKFPSTIKPQPVNIHDIIEIAGNNLKYIKIKQILSKIQLPGQNIVRIKHNTKKKFSFNEKL